MLLLKVGNIFTDIEGFLTPDQYRSLQRTLSFRPSGYEFSTMYNRWILDKQGKRVRRMWDGWRRQIWKTRNGSKIYFPTGLFSKAKEFFKKNNIKYSCTDCRVKPEKSISLTRNPEYQNRDYQEKIAQIGVNTGRGIIQVATGGGKTILAASLIQYLGVKPFIFFVTSIDLLIQAKEEFENILMQNGNPLEVGQIGGGVVDIKDINVMTVQTAVRAVGQKWDKDHKFDSDDEDDKTPLEQRRADILQLLKTAKGTISDEIQHWRAETCQLVARCLDLSYYTYGMSVAPDSFLYITNGIDKYSITIEELYKQYAQNNESTIKVSGIWVESVDTKELCPSWQKINSIIRHETENKILKITVDNGTIEITSDHSVFVLTENMTLKVKKGSELNKKDILVSPLYKNHNGFQPQHKKKDIIVDIGELFIDHLEEKELSKFIAVGSFPECKDFLKNKIDCQMFYRFFNRKKYNYLPFNVIKKYDLYHLLRQSSFYIKGKCKSNVFPKTISSLDLCFLIGLILGDGDINLTRLDISLGSQQEYIIVSNFMKTLGIKEQLYKRDKVYYVRYNNSILVGLLRILGLDKKCCHKEIPKKVFSFGIQSHRRLVQGLLLSDGYLSNSKERRRENFHYTTRSRNLAAGIHALFRIHGTLISIYRRAATKKFQNRDVKACIDRDFLLTCSTSSSPLLDNIYGLSFSQHKIPTRLKFLQKILDNCNIYKNRKYLHLNEFEQLTSYMTTRQKSICRNFKLLSIKVITQRTEKYVYDLSVDNTENFLANGILVHNSATPYRDEGDDIMIQACFGKKIVELSASKLIRDKWLIKPSIKIVHVRNEKSKFRQWQQLYKDQVTDNLKYNQMVSNIANLYINNGRLVLVLVQQLKHGKTLEALIPGSIFLSGKSSKKKRQENVNKLRNKELSCIVSTSLPYEEVILIKHCGFIKQVSIGDLCKNYKKEIKNKEIEVSCSKNGKTGEWGLVSNYHIHEKKNMIIRVQTNRSEDVFVTKNHSLVTSDLKTVCPQLGHLCCSPKGLPRATVCNYVDLLNLMSNINDCSLEVEIKNISQSTVRKLKSNLRFLLDPKSVHRSTRYRIKKELSNIKNKLDYKRAIEQLFVHFHYEKYKYRAKLNDVYFLKEIFKFFEARIFIRRSRKNFDLPIKFPITEELAILSGLMCGDGHIKHHTKGKTCKSIYAFDFVGLKDMSRSPDGKHDTNKRIIRRIFEKTFKQCFPQTKLFQNWQHLRFRSKLIYYLFKELGHFNHNGQKRVPDYIFNATSNIQEAFLYGLYLSDGSKKVNYRSPTKNASGMIISNSSRPLIAGILSLLHLLGHDFYCSTQPPIANKNTKRRYQICIKNSIFGHFFCTNRNADKLDYNTSDRFQKEITKCDRNDKYVYDISVEGCHNFIAGMSILCHNTIFDEGIDVRPLDTVILGGQGHSKVRAMQRIGRILRPFPGKTVATAIDFRIHQKYLLKHSILREKMYRTEEEFDIEEIDP